VIYFKRFFLALVLVNFLLVGVFGQKYNEPINVYNPNYAMLHEAIFRATNEVRQQYNLPLFVLDTALQQVAETHAQAMIEQNFYSHTNPYSNHISKLTDRVRYITGQSYLYQQLAENIAHYDLLATSSKFCLRKLRNGKYSYYYCKTNREVPIFTYKELAVSVLAAWMRSTSHRQNILDPNLRSLGTAVALSKNPYQTAAPPYARIVQNFGRLMVE
jgi:uncharacterized protein YkwD